MVINLESGQRIELRLILNPTARAEGAGVVLSLPAFLGDDPNRRSHLDVCLSKAQAEALIAQVADALK